MKPIIVLTDKDLEILDDEQTARWYANFLSLGHEAGKGQK